MQMPLLKAGDLVALVAPAKHIPSEYLIRAKQLLQSWGLQVIIGAHADGKQHYFSGTDDERLSDLQLALDNPEVKAIICARGGYGTIRIIDRINWDLFMQHPKWLVGFSDITVLHNHLHTVIKAPSIHGTVPLNFPEDGSENEALKTLKQGLMQPTLTYSFPKHKLNRGGDFSGVVVGGNLSILHNLVGTNSDLDTCNKVLFFEDLCEPAYHVDRMLWAMKKAGKFENLKGLLVGGMTDITHTKEMFDQTISELILDNLKEYDFPIVFDFPAGHWERNFAIRLGLEAKLISTTSNITFQH